MLRLVVCRLRAKDWRRGGLALLGALTLALAYTPAYAQSLDSVLTGKLSDESGAALPGATVVATQDATAVMRSAVADGGGRYVLLNLPAGTYTLRAELAGFAATTRKAQTLYVGTTVNIDFELKLAGIASQERNSCNGGLRVLERSSTGQPRAAVPTWPTAMLDRAAEGRRSPTLADARFWCYPEKRDRSRDYRSRETTGQQKGQIKWKEPSKKS